MTTALEVALKRAEALEWIPRMTHPLSKVWQQPDRSEITVDDKYALMDRKAFSRLKEYSSSIPSALYVGKMWKRGWPFRDPRLKWFLCYVVPHEDPTKVVIREREIVLI